jgi:hypothetical protein
MTFAARGCSFPDFGARDVPLKRGLKYYIIEGRESKWR